mmetsp:Transcript_8938/g.16077  ORF Transcript_8938/g.16077 Transcript_8938/m.16077 type:complete len:264 (+) Transcript_8938:104-895(+)
MDPEDGPFDFHFIEEGHILPLEPEVAMVLSPNLLTCQDRPTTTASAGTQVPTEHPVDKILQTDGFEALDDASDNEDDDDSAGSTTEEEVATLRQDLEDESYQVGVLNDEIARLERLQTKQEKAMQELHLRIMRMKLWMVAILATALLLLGHLAVSAMSTSVALGEGCEMDCALCPQPETTGFTEGPVTDPEHLDELCEEVIVALGRKISVLRQKVSDKEVVATRLRSCLEASTSTAVVVWQPEDMVVWKSEDNLSMPRECISH